MQKRIIEGYGHSFGLAKSLSALQGEPKDYGIDRLRLEHLTKELSKTIEELP